MPVSPLQAAKRALVSVLLHLARVYNLAVNLNRDSTDADILPNRPCVDSVMEGIPTSWPNADDGVIIVWSQLPGDVSKQGTQAQPDCARTKSSSLQSST